MKIDPIFLEKSINNLDYTYEKLINTKINDKEYEIFNVIAISEIDNILEQSGKLLKKILKLYSHSSKAVDILYFKDIYRHAVLHSIIDRQECERCFNGLQITFYFISFPRKF